MENAHVCQLLDGLPLTGLDAARFVLEVTEEMPGLKETATFGKEVLMQVLRRIMRAGIVSIQEQELTVTFEKAAAESLAQREAAGRRPTTLRDLRHFIRRLQRVPEFANKPLRGINTTECRQALNHAFAGSAHSFRKGRAVLHSIFAYGVRQGWCSINPVSAIEIPSVEEKEITPLSISECQRLMNVAKTPDFRDCLPALGLMLFAGVRPAEITRLRWADVHCSEGVLIISARHSKTGGARCVELCPSLRRLLRKQQPSGTKLKMSSLCPPQWQKRWKHLREAAGLVSHCRRWIPDVLRHTFASYHVLTHKNLPFLQLQLGHRDSRLLLTRYLNLPPLIKTKARQFWQLAD